MTRLVDYQAVGLETCTEWHGFWTASHAYWTHRLAHPKVSTDLVKAVASQTQAALMLAELEATFPELKRVEVAA